MIHYHQRRGDPVCVSKKKEFGPTLQEILLP